MDSDNWDSMFTVDNDCYSISLTKNQEEIRNIFSSGTNVAKRLKLNIEFKKKGLKKC